MTAQQRIVEEYVHRIKQKIVYLTDWERNFIAEISLLPADTIKDDRFHKLEQIYNKVNGRGER